MVCGPGAPMLAQASIICCPETEALPASRAWLLASLMTKQMNSVAHSCTSLFASLDILVLYPRLLLASSLAMILAMHAIGNCGGGGGGRRVIGRQARSRVPVQQHLLLGILGQSEGIRQ